jgi:hypothetical protein
LRTGNSSNAAAFFGRIFRHIAFAVRRLSHKGRGIVARGISTHLEPFMFGCPIITLFAKHPRNRP